MPVGNRWGRLGALLLLAVLVLGLPVALLSCAGRPAPPAPESREGPVLRIALSAAPASLSVPGAWAAYDAGDGAFLRRGNSLRGSLSPDPGGPGRKGIRVGDTVFGASRIRIDCERDGFVLNGIPYPGSLVLQRSPAGRLSAQNRVPMERYLPGVLGSELPGDWPGETLRALAVAARTYAMARAGDRAGEAYDLTDDVMDQCYQGRLKETEASRRAVSDTAGVLLTWRRRIFLPYYSAVCGGRTGDVLKALDREPRIPPLLGRACPYCEKALPEGKRDRFRWKKALPRRDLEKALGAGGRLLSVEPLDPDAGGHACRVRIGRLGGGSRDLPMLDFRRAAGISSNAWTAEVRGDEVVFEGRGFGHGVGLCQWGSKGMGDAGFDFQEILRFYYPGAELQRRY